MSLIGQELTPDRIAKSGRLAVSDDFQIVMCGTCLTKQKSSQENHAPDLTRTCVAPRSMGSSRRHRAGSSRSLRSARVSTSDAN